MLYQEDAPSHLLPHPHELFQTLLHGIIIVYTASGMEEAQLNHQRYLSSISTRMNAFSESLFPNKIYKNWDNVFKSVVSK